MQRKIAVFLARFWVRLPRYYNCEEYWLKKYSFKDKYVNKDHEYYLNRILE